MIDKEELVEANLLYPTCGMCLFVFVLRVCFYKPFLSTLIGPFPLLL